MTIIGPFSSKQTIIAYDDDDGNAQAQDDDDGNAQAQDDDDNVVVLLWNHRNVSFCILVVGPLLMTSRTILDNF